MPILPPSATVPSRGIEHDLRTDQTLLGGRPTIATLAALHTSVGGGAVAVTAPDGTIGFGSGAVTGLYHGDRRLLSRLRVLVPGHDVELLSSTRPGPDRRVTHWLVADPGTGGRALLSDLRVVAGGLRLELTVRALEGPTTLDLRLELATDLADLLALRDGHPAPAALPCVVRGDGLLVGDDHLGAVVSAPGATVDESGASWTVTAGANAPATVSLQVRPRPDPGAVPSTPTTLRVTGSDRWQRAIASAVADLAALRMRDTAHGLAWIGAGAPWYMALFGRDALLTAYEALPLGAAPALDVLDALAAFQGTTHDPATGEEPGKVLHELRTGHSGVFGLEPWQPYFGSVDATPLFVVVLAEARRWGADDDRVRALLPAARRAIAWCRDTAAGDAHGYLTYEADATGLANQGWKDSADAMVHDDGARARGRIALVEAQAYHWRALEDLAELEDGLGAAPTAAGLRGEAARLRARVRADFVRPRRGRGRSDGGRVTAMALDGAGRRLDVASSNAGHLLWTGLLEGADAGALADRLAAPDLNAGWGIRTLSSDATSFDPLSYHRGTIWPHDSALVIDGLARAGRGDVAADLIDGLLTVAEHDGWRLPELFAGYGRDAVPAPVPYPAACSPQAWSAAAPLALLRTLLRIDPDVASGTLTVGPVLGDDLDLRVEGLRLGPHLVDVAVCDGRVEVRADPPLRINVRRRSGAAGV